MTKVQFSVIVRIGIVLLLISACQSPTATKTPVGTQTPFPTLTHQKSITPFPSQYPSTTPTLSLSEKLNLADLKGVQLHFWHPFLDKTADQLSKLADKFNSENLWGIQVDVTSQGNSSDLFRQIQALLSGTGGSEVNETQLPDVVMASPEQAMSWENMSPILVSLNDYISDASLGLTAQDISDFSVPYWELGSMNNEQWGLPAMGSLQFIFYNLTWAKELGFSQPPTTTEEFRQQACTAALANQQDSVVGNDGTGGWLVSTDDMTMLGWISAFNGKVNSYSASQYLFNTPEITTAFTFLKNLIGNDCAWLGLNPDPYDYFASRKALFYSGSLEDIDPQIAVFAADKNEDSWTIIPIPGSRGLPVVMSYGPCYYIIKSTNIQQLAAWLFIRWMDAPAQQSQIIRTNNTFPIRKSEIALLNDYQNNHPQWATAIQFLPFATIPPNQASWQVISNILEDASQQLFQPETTVDQIPSILSQMDEMTSELLTRSP